MITHRRAGRRHAFTLIEMLVAAAVTSLLLVGAVHWALSLNRATTAAVTSLAGNDELATGRAALLRDVRGATLCDPGRPGPVQGASDTSLSLFITDPTTPGRTLLSTWITGPDGTLTRTTYTHDTSGSYSGQPCRGYIVERSVQNFAVLTAGSMFIPYDNATQVPVGAGTSCQSGVEPICSTDQVTISWHSSHDTANVTYTFELSEDLT